MLVVILVPSKIRFMPASLVFKVLSVRLIGAGVLPWDVGRLRGLPCLQEGERGAESCRVFKKVFSEIFVGSSMSLVIPRLALPTLKRLLIC